MNENDSLLQNDFTRVPLHSNFSFQNKNIRIILVGKTGAGKSATGNTILRQKAFESELSPAAVTKQCRREFVQEGGRSVCVTDTPGFCGSLTGEKIKTQLQQCVELSVPGPHAFLLVINLDARFTAEEKNTVEQIQQNFGADAMHHTIILFTRADQLEGRSLQWYVSRCPDLRKLMGECGGRYHAFNNKDMRNRSQVSELLEKIDRMIQGNGGIYYSNWMFEEAQKKIERKEMMKKVKEGALAVGSAVGTGTAIVGGILGLPEAVVTVGAGVGLGMATKLVTDLVKNKKKQNCFQNKCLDLSYFI